ncbi:MAG TPA: S41 family peptidase, partial [Anaerolineae bacterium]|nr:S41 family peptidase [Anaerolineae bacterium]
MDTLTLPTAESADAPESAPPPKTRKRPVRSILGTTVTLEDFLAQADSSDFDRQARERIVDQALVLIEQLYVHLPLKRAMHAVDPVQRLKLLRRRLGAMSELQFNREMLSIFTELRDLHTNYLLPEPYRDRAALLPFLIEEFYEGGKRHYMVSHVVAGFRHPWFKPGVIVTHWNGLPIERAVALNAEQQAGSNEDARHARGLEAMTIRPLMLTVPPDEEWVTVRYLAKGEPHDAQFRWRVIEPPLSPNAVDPDLSDSIASYGLGYDALAETARRVKKALFAPRALETEKRMSELGAHPPDPQDKAALRDLKKHSTMPDVFDFRSVETPYGKFGYIRIWTFLVADAEYFVNEFVRIAGMLPQNGLIIDVRGNPGGLISAGELLLQVLTPRTIEPCRLHLINSPLTLALCERVEALSRWRDSI